MIYPSLTVIEVPFIHFRHTKLTRGVFVPPIITRSSFSRHIYNQEDTFQFIFLCLDLLVLPSSLCNESVPASAMPSRVIGTDVGNYEPKQLYRGGSTSEINGLVRYVEPRARVFGVTNAAVF